jgi:hypothetical protein
MARQEKLSLSRWDGDGGEEKATKMKEGAEAWWRDSE